MSNRGRGFGRLHIAFSFAFTLAGALFLGYYGGAWLDGRYDTFPWFSTLGIVLGLTAAFRALWRELQRSGPDGPQGGS
ncbi:MAG: AtpZ/AtpI family protein [Thermaerobacterales bacterium]